VAKPKYARPPKGDLYLGAWSGKPGVANPRDAPGRQWVIGGGMIGRFDDVKQGDRDGNKSVFMLEEPKSRPPRSQSIHSSDEAG
jgi:hypothetical protein